MEQTTINHGIVHLSLETHAPVDPGGYFFWWSLPKLSKIKHFLEKKS